MTEKTNMFGRMENAGADAGGSEALFRGANEVLSVFDEAENTQNKTQHKHTSTAVERRKLGKKKSKQN